MKLAYGNWKLPVSPEGKPYIISDNDYLINVKPVTRNKSSSTQSNTGGNVVGGGIIGASATTTLTATTNTNYSFLGWATSPTGTSYASTSVSYTFTPTNNAIYYGIFRLNNYNVNATAVTRNSSGSTASTTGGTTTGTANYDLGDTVTITATPKVHYSFVGWATSTTGTSYVSTNSTYTFTCTSAVTYYAIFKLDMHNVTATAVTRNSSTSTNSTTGGTVSGSGSKDYGSSATFTATAATGYTFQGWATSNDATSYVSTNASYTFTVSGNVTYYAIFKANQYTVTPTAVTRVMSTDTSTVSTTGGTVSGGATKDYGASITLTATAASNYSFAGWSTSTTGTSYVSTNASYTHIISGNTTLYAIFVKVETFNIHYYTSGSSSPSVEIVSWSEGTDEEIVAMLEAAHDGIIDLQEDGDWAVGDVRTITVGAFTDGSGVSHAQQQVNIAITSFAEYEGCGNVLQFDFMNPISELTKMNTSSTNTYSSTIMYTTTLPALVNVLPTWLKNSLLTFSVKSNANGNATSASIVTNNKLALRSAVEIGALTTGIYANEGSLVSYYRGLSNWKKPKFDNSTIAWWLRSPYSGSTTNFVRIQTGGTSNNYVATNTQGICPFGCL